MQVGLCRRVADAAHKDPVGDQSPVLDAAAGAPSVEKGVGVRMTFNIKWFYEFNSVSSSFGPSWVNVNG